MFLYPSEVPDPLLRFPLTGATCYGNFTRVFTADQDEQPMSGTAAWTQQASPALYTWVRNENGQLHGTAVGDSAGGLGDGSLPYSYPVQTGDVLAVIYIDGTDYWHCGLYDVLDAGSDTTPAIIRRSASANTPAGLCHGMTVQVTGGGLRNGKTAYNVGFYSSITTADPIVVDTTDIYFGMPTTSYSPANTYPLLTSAQLVTAGADNDDTLTFSAMSVSGGEVYFPYGGFLTLAGTPGLSSLPAGLYGVSLENVCLDNAYDGSANSVKAYIIDALSSTIVATLTSPPITWTAPRTITFQANLSSAYAILPTSRLKTVFSFTNSSPYARTCTFTYSSPIRQTWVQLPIQAASAGVTLTGELTPPFWDTYVAIETAPTVKDERMCDFDRLRAANPGVEFTAYAKADSGQTGTLAIMIGGTKDTADGTTIATTTVIGSGAYAAIKVAATFANPGSLQAVKLALESSDAAHPFFVQGGYLTLGSTTS
jgi:hypothetical protein